MPKMAATTPMMPVAYGISSEAAPELPSPEADELPMGRLFTLSSHVNLPRMSSFGPAIDENLLHELPRLFEDWRLNAPLTRLRLGSLTLCKC